MADKKLTVMKEQNLQAVSLQQRIVRILVKTGVYLFLSVMALIVLFPFYWMIISSLKDLAEYRLNIPTLWPQKLVFANYAGAFEKGNLGKLFLNTAYVGIVSTLLSLVITVLSAFAFARLEFKGKDAMFAALLATMMIPGELFTITNYATINAFGSFWLISYTILFLATIICTQPLSFPLVYPSLNTGVPFVTIIFLSTIIPVCISALDAATGSFFEKAKILFLTTFILPKCW